jgi:hypothetical protein
MAWLCFVFCRGPAFRFFGRRRVGAMADRRHHGEDAARQSRWESRDNQDENAPLPG